MPSKLYIANETKEQRERRLKLDAAAQARYRASLSPEVKRERRIRRCRRYEAIIREAKQKPCADCGQPFPLVCMDFHHVRGEKRFNLAVAAAAQRPIGQIRAEIAKCDVVCANCHRIRHAPSQEEVGAALAG